MKWTLIGELKLRGEGEVLVRATFRCPDGCHEEPIMFGMSMPPEIAHPQNIPSPTCRCGLQMERIPDDTPTEETP